MRLTPRQVIGLLLVTMGMLTAPALAAQLLFSNAPERVLKPALLYQATTSGPARLVLHHLNGTADSFTLEVRVANMGELPAVVAWRLYAYRHKDPTLAGHYAVKQFWLDKEPLSPATVLAPQTEEVLGSMSFPPKETVSAIAVLNASEPVRVRIVARPAKGPFEVSGPPLSTVTFPLADLYDEVPYTLPRGPVVVSVGRGNFLDNVTGLLRGNYGVVHQYRILAQNPTNLPYRLNISSRQAGGVSRAFVQIDGELLPIPTSARYEKQLLTYRVLPAHTQVALNLATLPQPGSNMPIDFILESTPATP